MDAQQLSLVPARPAGFQGLPDLEIRPAQGIEASRINGVQELVEAGAPLFSMGWAIGDPILGRPLPPARPLSPLGLGEFTVNPTSSSF